MTEARAVAMSSPDVDAIRAVLIEYQDAWNAHDMTALEELFTDDAHWVNIVGMHWQGKMAIIKAHSVFHRTIFWKTELIFGDIGIRAINSDVAAAVVTATVGTFRTPDGADRPSADNRLSFILTKRDGAWRVAHGHNTVIDPVAQPFDPVSSGWSSEPGQ
jgi:uncharacterized protein (TIGR02246 family)